MKPRIFKENGRVYLSFHYVPPKLPHRERELNYLLETVKSLFDGEIYEYNIPVIYGPTGTGKTTTIKKLIEIMNNYESRVRVFILYVNCGIEQRPFNVAQRIAEEILETSIRGYSYEEILNMIYDAMEIRDEYLLLILDEVDELIRNDKGRLLHIITRLEERVGGVRRIFPVLIARKYESILDLPSYVRNKISGPTLHFKPYTKNQIKDIINDRIELALNPNTISENAIDVISYISAIIDRGDARSAIILLLNSGNIAEHSGDKKIIVEHVRKAYEQRSGLLISKYLSSLDPKTSRIMSCLLNVLKQNLDEYLICIEKNYQDLQICMAKNFGYALSYDDIGNLLEKLYEKRMLYKENNTYLFISLSIESLSEIFL